MKLKNRYFLLRHGETIYQKGKKDFIYPWPDYPPIKLTKEGKKMIKKAAEKLKKYKIDLIYSSDVFRTRQTAKIVAKELNIKKINFDKRLRDVNLGIYHGRKKEEFYQLFPKYSKKRFYQKPEKGESWQDVQKRLKDLLKDIEKKQKNRHILIISHGDPLWLLEGVVKNWSKEKLLETRIKKYIKVGEIRKL